MRKVAQKLSLLGASGLGLSLLELVARAQSDITTAMTTLSTVVWPAAATLGVTIFLFMLSRRLANRGIAGR